MTVNDLSTKFGNRFYIIIKLHWDFDEDTHTYSHIESDDIYSIMEIMGDYEIDSDEAIFINVDNETKQSILTIYVENPKDHNKRKYKKKVGD